MAYTTTEAPATTATTDDPTTLATTDVPTTLATTDDPTTLATTDDPTTLATTVDPTTLATTEDPTTLVTTEAPTTLATTEAPTPAGNGSFSINIIVWYFIHGTCILFIISVIMCPLLTTPTDGMTITYVPNNDSPTSGGTVATYKCHSGYALNGGNNRTCQNDGIWSGGEPTCGGA